MVKVVVVVIINIWYALSSLIRGIPQLICSNNVNTFMFHYTSVEYSVASPDQIFCAHTAALSKEEAWTPSLVKLGPNYKVYQHVVAPIRLLREVNHVLHHHK